MPVHVTLNNGEPGPYLILPHVPRLDVSSTCFTLSDSGSRSPGTHLATMLARTFPCQNRSVLCVRDWTRRRLDDHDSGLVASRSYDELREIQWGAYEYCLPFLPDFLSHTPRLERLIVGALYDAETPLKFPMPGRTPLSGEQYTFSLTSLECSAIFSAEAIVRVVMCSTHTLRHLYLVIHAYYFNALATTLPELPALRSFTILPADGLGNRELISRFLFRFPRLVALTVAVEYPDAWDGVHIWAPSSPHLHSLTVYATYRYWSRMCTQSFQDALKDWPRLRRFDLAVNPRGCTVEEEQALRYVCAPARVALCVTRFPRPRFPRGSRLPGVVPATYEDYPRL